MAVKPEIFFVSGDVTTPSPVLYREYYCIQDGNLVPSFSLLFTTHAPLPIFQEELCRVRVHGLARTGKFAFNTDTYGRGYFLIRKEKVADSKLSGYAGALSLKQQQSTVAVAESKRRLQRCGKINE